MGLEFNPDWISCDMYDDWPDFCWWCLAHNFDQAATLAALADVSWQRGFDTGRTIAGFCSPAEQKGANP